MSRAAAAATACLPQLEDDVCGALRMLGHHLGNTASNLFRSTPPQETARLQHLRDLHPLLLQQQRSSEPIAPGLALLDQETPAHVSACPGSSRASHCPLPPLPAA